jgi:hypothetical protein
MNEITQSRSRWGAVAFSILFGIGLLVVAAYLFFHRNDFALPSQGAINLLLSLWGIASIGSGAFWPLNRKVSLTFSFVGLGSFATILLLFLR